jgi:hypothetical protein
MRYSRYLSIAMLITTAALIFTTAGCFSNSNSGDNSPTVQATSVKPKPSVTSVVATTSGTADAYYAILDIRVKNDGAEGTINVVATVTQSGKINQREMPVYLKQGETHELKLTFPLVWKGGDWTPKVQTQVP